MTSPDQLERTCVCGEPLHVGSVLRSSTAEEGVYEAIVIKVGPVTSPPMHRPLYLVSLTKGVFIQHVGDLLTWQMEVGYPVSCGTAADVPPPCSSIAPGCQDSRQARLNWERENLL